MNHKAQEIGTVGIIGAMDSEVTLLKSALQNAQEEKVGGLTLSTGNIGQAHVVLAKCGVGKVNAALCAQIMIDRFSADCLINTGAAGGIGADGELAVGDFVIGTEAVQYDFDVTAFGHAKGYMCTGVQHEQPTIYHSDPLLVAAVERSATKWLPQFKLKNGRIATGDTFVSESRVKNELWQDFQATAAEMEGAAIAQTATANDIPFVIVRAISDLADDSAATSYDEFEKEAAGISANIVIELLKTEFGRKETWPITRKSNQR
jgi:adenosylhomocysteine nucleosidase